MTKFARHIVISGILTCLILFHLGNNILWLAKDNLPPAWDQAIHLSLGLDYYYLLINPSWHLPISLLEVSNYYPPVHHIMVALFYLVWGKDNDIGTLVSTFALIILIFSTYGIAIRLSKNKMVGLLGTFLISMYPVNIVLSRECWIDLTLAATVSLSIYLLMLTEGFTKRGYAILFGLSVGLGMLTKWSFPFFLALPVIAILWKSRFNEGFGKNFLFSLIPSLSLPIPWYLRDFKDLFTNINTGYYAGLQEGYPPVYSVQSVVYYFFTLVKWQIFPLLFLLFLIGLIFSLKRYRSESLILFLWLLGAYIMFTFSVNKNPRYTVPALVPVALISVRWIADIRNFLTKTIIILFICFGLLNQYYLISFGLHPAPLEYISNRLREYKIDLFPLENYQQWTFAQPPSKADWQIFNILHSIYVDNKNKKTEPKVGIIPNLARFNRFSFIFYAKLYHYPLRIEKIDPINQLVSDLQWFDYFITKGGDNGVGVSAYDAQMIHKFGFNLEQGIEIELLGEFSLPDYTTARIYKICSGHN